MTLKELSQLYWLNKEIAEYERQLRDIWASMGPSGPMLTGMPKAHSGESAVERAATEIAELQAMLDSMLTRRREERIKLERYIMEIPDSQTRLIFRYRFVDGNSWPRVARRVGGKNTEASVKMTCYRYLHETQKKERAQPQG